MNLAAKYYLAIYIKGGKIVHKEFITVYLGGDAAARVLAEKFASENNISYDEIDVTYTGEEDF